MNLCRSGELCNNKQHIETEHGFEPCSCYYFTIQKRRLIAGNFSDIYQTMTADEALSTSGYRSHMIARGELDPAAYLKSVATWLMKRPSKMLKIPDIDGATNTTVLGCYLAAQAALSMSVLLATCKDVVDAEFKDKGAALRFASVDFLVLWGFGCDTEHAWLRVLIYRLLQTRSEHRRPTVICYGRGGYLHVAAIYGNAASDFLQDQHCL